jgi:hypothetical protein
MPDYERLDKEDVDAPAGRIVLIDQVGCLAIVVDDLVARIVGQRNQPPAVVSPDADAGCAVNVARI